jgi:hypothetical protein
VSPSNFVARPECRFVTERTLLLVSVHDAKLTEFASFLGAKRGWRALTT